MKYTPAMPALSCSANHGFIKDLVPEHVTLIRLTCLNKSKRTSPYLLAPTPLPHPHSISHHHLFLAEPPTLSHSPPLPLLFLFLTHALPPVTFQRRFVASGVGTGSEYWRLNQLARQAGFIG